MDPAPIAAASVGQVHTAQLADAYGGGDVVVKVQRPTADAQIRTDLDILSILGTRLMRSAEWARRIGLDDLVDGFAASLKEELDDRVEASNAESVRAGVSPDEPISVPAIVGEVSTRRVLVMEHAVGVPLARACAQLAQLAPEERSTLAAALVLQVMKEVLVTGIFHADLHPGNVLLDGTDRLVILDFGSVGRLDDVSRSCLAMLLAAVSNNDSQAATDSLVELLGRPDTDLIDLARRSGTELLTPDMTAEGMRTAIGRSMASNMPVLRRIPRQFGRLVEQAEQGRLSARIRILVASKR